VSKLESVHAGLSIILKYKDKTPAWESYINCDGEKIYAGECIGIEMSDEDHDKMENLGWFEDEDRGSWYIHV